MSGHPHPRPGKARPCRGRPDGSAYLPAGRTPAAALLLEIARVAASEVGRFLLQSDIPIAIVNGRRQLVGANARFAELIGLQDPGAALGLRPGELLGCVHVSDGPDGCGTSPSCASCGAAFAMLGAVHRRRNAERTCSVRIERDGAVEDVALRFRAAPLQLGGEQYAAISITERDTGEADSALRGAFLHDLTNLACELKAACGLLGQVSGGALAREIGALSEQLLGEVTAQRALEDPGYRIQVENRPFRVLDVLGRVAAAARPHPAAEGKTLEVARIAPDLRAVGDPLLVHHVLAHMWVNAFEGTPRGGQVRLVAEPDGDAVRLRVWNAGAIPAAIRGRIFQRHFSTKGPGRGQGTYAMKLFGEKLLGGTVRYESSREDGTWFELRLPQRAAADA